MNPIVLAAFTDELQKLASASLLRRGVGAGASLLRGASKDVSNSVGKFFKRHLYDGVVGGPLVGKHERSLVGSVKAFTKHPGKALNEEWLASGKLGKGFTALSLGLSASDIANAKGADRSGAIGSAIGNNLGYLALGRVPFAAQMAGSMAAGSVGNHLGRGAGSLLGQKSVRELA